MTPGRLPSAHAIRFADHGGALPGSAVRRPHSSPSNPPPHRRCKSPPLLLNLVVRPSFPRCYQDCRCQVVPADDVAARPINPRAIHWPDGARGTFELMNRNIWIWDFGFHFHGGEEAPGWELPRSGRPACCQRARISARVLPPPSAAAGAGLAVGMGGMGAMATDYKKRRGRPCWRSSRLPSRHPLPHPSPSPSAPSSSSSESQQSATHRHHEVVPHGRAPACGPRLRPGGRHVNS